MGRVDKKWSRDLIPPLFFHSKCIEMDDKKYNDPIRINKEVFKKFGMEEYSLVSTPMVTWCKLKKDDESPKVVLS